MTIKRSFYGSSAIAQKCESYDSLGKIVAYENYDHTGGVLAQGSYQYDSINRLVRLDVDYNYSFEDCVKKSERYHYSDKAIFSNQADKIQRICANEKGREVVYTTYVQTE